MTTFPRFLLFLAIVFPVGFGIGTALYLWEKHASMRACQYAVAPPNQDVFYVAPNGSGEACTLACPCAMCVAGQRMMQEEDTLILRAGTDVKNDERVE